MRIVLIGPGKVGSALARALGTAPQEVLAIIGRGAPLPEALGDAEVILLAVPDAAIGSVAAALAASGRLRADAVVLHTAGALGVDALAALGGAAHGGTFHPLQTFPSKEASPPLFGVPFALGGDAQALAAGESLARHVGGVPLVVPDCARALYHAAAVLACGHVALLADAAARALSSAANVRHDEALRLLAPILATTTRNLAVLGLPAALTGPVARGDAQTLARHEAALRAVAPELAQAYAALAGTAKTA